MNGRTGYRYSAIVPNYNDAKNIGASLDTLKQQTHLFDEIIIVDDCSTDDSVEVITRLIANMPNAKLVRHAQNGGVVAALNTGIEAATGDYVFLCSANDTYHTSMVQWCEEMLQQHPNVGMVSGNAAAWDETRARPDKDRLLPLPQRRAYYSPRDLVRYHRKMCIHFNGGANALRRDLMLRFGGLRPELEWHCDWFLYQLIALEAGIVYVPEAFSVIRLEGKKSYSSGHLDWSREKHVIRHSILALREFPQHAPLFKEAALLPMYQLKEPQMLLDPELRWFVTPLLLWRNAVYLGGYWAKHFLPRPWLMMLRRFVRV